MRINFTLFTCLCLLLTTSGFTQVIWDGPTITFTKANNADFNLEQNQDRLTDDIWITRKANKGIFNIATESDYVEDVSPEGTEWAFGTTADVGSLTFDDWETTVMENPPSMVGQDMVVHLITDDIYIDIKFTSWQGSNAGGGFAYERSSSESTHTVETQQSRLEIFPNPTTDYLQIRGLSPKAKGTILNLQGSKMMDIRSGENQPIDIRALPSGVYFLKLENASAVRFIKQ